MITIRAEHPPDFAGVRHVNERAYPRFGFESAAKHGLRCQWESVPDEAFMTRILDPGAMAGVSGVATYRPEFSEV